MPENTILGNVTSDVISDQQFEYMRLISQIMQDRKRGDKPVAYIRTYGCQQNVADSERIKGMLEIAGFEFSETVDDADFILLIPAQSENTPRTEFWKCRCVKVFKEKTSADCHCFVRLYDGAGAYRKQDV